MRKLRSGWPGQRNTPQFLRREYAGQLGRHHVALEVPGRFTRTLAVPRRMHCGIRCLAGCNLHAVDVEMWLAVSIDNSDMRPTGDRLLRLQDNPRRSAAPFIDSHTILPRSDTGDAVAGSIDCCALLRDGQEAGI